MYAVKGMVLAIVFDSDKGSLLLLVHEKTYYKLAYHNYATWIM